MWFIFLCSMSIVYIAMHISFHYVHQYYKNLPPGPIPIPIIGNLHLLGTSPHVSMKEISQKYGDIYRIYFGSELAIVVTQIDYALEGLIQKGAEFAGRPRTYTLDLASGNGKGIAFADYGPMWRLVRKIGHSSLRMYGDGLKNLESLIIKESEELHKRLDEHVGKSLNPHHNIGKQLFLVLKAFVLSLSFIPKVSWNRSPKTNSLSCNNVV